MVINYFNFSLNVIKYILKGPCQFPTLGFVVDRYWQIENFISEKFWYIECKYEKDKLMTIFNWKRNRLYFLCPMLVTHKKII